MRWTAHVEGGPQRVNHAAVRIDDKIFSFGGYYSCEEYKDWEPIPVHILDTTTLRWSVVKYLNNEVVPFQRYGHTTVAYGDLVYMWGGRNNAVACVTLSCFNTKTLEWTIPDVGGMVPYAKDGHSACLIKNRMYIFGGFEYLTNKYSQEVHYLDLDTLKWTLVDATGDFPSHRDFHTAVAAGDRLYVFGGRGDLNSPYDSYEELYCPHIYYLDTVKEVWVVLNPAGTWPEGRRSHSAWLHNDSMYIFGGFNGNTKQHFNDLHRYSIKDNSWHRLNVEGKAPCKRRRQACLIYKDQVFLFAGTSPCPTGAAPPATEPGDVDEEQLVDNNDLHLLDYSPTLKTLCMLAVLEHNLEQVGLPRDIILDIRAMSVPNRISRPLNQAG